MQTEARINGIYAVGVGSREKLDSGAMHIAHQLFVAVEQGMNARVQRIEIGGGKIVQKKISARIPLLAPGAKQILAPRIVEETGVAHPRKAAEQSQRRRLPGSVLYEFFKQRRGF